MQCVHPTLKQKLISWGTDSRYGHEQGFRYVDCCAECGIEMPTDNGMGNMLVFAARYTHDRQTAGAHMVVTTAIRQWSQLPTRVRKQLVSESHEATYNRDDWKRLRDHAEAYVKETEESIHKDSHMYRKED
jgi:hypothetical protein